MNIAALLSLSACGLSLFLGTLVYSLNKKKLLNRIFMLMCVSIGYWAFSEFMYRQSENPNTAYLWLKAGFMWPFSIALLLHFSLAFSEKTRGLRKKTAYFLIYVPALFFSSIELTTDLISTKPVESVWGYTYGIPENSWLFWTNTIWASGTALIALVLCLKYYFEAKDEKKKQQAKYVSIGFSIPILSTLLLEGLNLVSQMGVPELSTFSIAGLGVFVGYAIWKHELFAISPATVAENIITTMPDSLILSDSNGKILTVNQSLLNLSGYTEDELIGKSVDILFVEEQFGSKILKKSLEKGTITDYETKFKTKFGEEIHASFSGSVVKGKEERIAGIIHIVRDITERKEAERMLRSSMEKLKVLNEKLNIVGKLTRHDVRNKLSTILNNLYLARQRTTNDRETLRYLSEVESACEQTVKIFDFARNYERLGVEEPAYINVGKSLDEALSLNIDLQGVKVVNECYGLRVLADSMLRQLFYNLIDNSLKHGEKINRIRVYHREIGKDHLKIVYEDDGIGIPKAEKEQIFQEGYGKGTGYGLYLIKKMCEVYDWTIRETGKHGKGAQFTITIPTALTK